MRLGLEAKDKVTGFRGILVSKIEYLNGCIQYSIRPQKTNKDGKPFEGEWFDVQQIEILGPGISSITKNNSGGPTTNAPTVYRA